MKKLSVLALSLLVALTVGGAFAQEAAQEAEQAAEQAEQAAEQAGEAAESAGEAAGEAAQEADQAVEEGVDDLGVGEADQEQQVEPQTGAVVRLSRLKDLDLIDPEAAAQLQQEQPQDGTLGTGDAGAVPPEDQQAQERSFGSIDDIVLTSDGRISHVLANLDNYRGLESGKYLIPFDSFSVEAENVRLNVPDPSQLVLVEDEELIRQNFEAGSVQASRFMDYEVLGTDGESLGGIDEIVLDSQSGQILYVALGRGGFLGIGGDHVAVPYGDLQYDIQAEQISLGVTRDQFDDLQGFSGDAWPTQADENWDQNLSPEATEEQQDDTLGAGEDATVPDTTVPETTDPQY